MKFVELPKVVNRNKKRKRTCFACRGTLGNKRYVKRGFLMGDEKEHWLVSLHPVCDTLADIMFQGEPLEAGFVQREFVKWKVKGPKGLLLHMAKMSQYETVPEAGAPATEAQEADTASVAKAGTRRRAKKVDVSRY